MNTLQRRPQLDAKKCNGCGACERFCNWGVLEYDAIGSTAVLSETRFCHPTCRICSVVCPQGGITFRDVEEFITNINVRLAGIGRINVLCD